MDKSLRDVFVTWQWNFR